MPQSDAHLVLAQTDGGLFCFFLPRLLPDGTRNAVQIEHLKDKLGNCSNASSEVEFFNATGWLIGEEGEGVRQILKMGGYTRFDCALGSHGLMRHAFSVALYHTHQRQVQGKNVLDQTMMRQVLCAQALLLEGKTAMLMRLARAWSQPDDVTESGYVRLLTPAAKFVVCKRGIPFVADAMEVLGGSAIAKRVSYPVCTGRCLMVPSPGHCCAPNLYLEFPISYQYDYASIFQSYTNTFLASMGHG